MMIDMSVCVYYVSDQASRIALLHSLANIEQWAIDLSWDVIARFSSVRLDTGEPLPRQFFSDFVKVAGDEAKVSVRTYISLMWSVTCCFKYSSLSAYFFQTSWGESGIFL